MNVAGLLSLIVFYLLILGVGIWAAWHKRKKGGTKKSETNMVAGRDITILLGCFTMTGRKDAQFTFNLMLTCVQTLPKRENYYLPINYQMLCHLEKKLVGATAA